MTADPSTHPPTEAVGEVRRELLAVRLECIETTLNDDGTARLQRGELIAGEGRFLGEVLCTPDEYVALYTALTAAEKLRAEVERLRARIHEAVDECQRRYGPVESQLAKCRGLMREALRRHDETSGHPPGTHISGYGQAAAAAILEERDQARSDLAAMTLERDRALAVTSPAPEFPRDDDRWYFVHRHGGEPGHAHHASHVHAGNVPNNEHDGIPTAPFDEVRQTWTEAPEVLGDGN